MKKIALFIFDGVQLLDIAGACDVFTEANQQAGEALYQVELVAASLLPVRTSSQVMVSPARTLRSLSDVHTFLVPGGPGADGIVLSSAQIRALEDAADGAARYGSICTGAFLMARTSLVKRKRITTHWAFAEQFRALFPEADLQPERMFTKHGRFYSSAGVSAGMDLCLALVEEDFGADLALRVSQHLVMALRRGGSQMQFSRKEDVTLVGRSTLEILRKKISKRLQEDLRVDVLASEVGLSARHLTRLFHKELNSTPAKWVEDLRLDQVKELLVTTKGSPKEIAFQSGFLTDNSLRRTFLRRFGITPSQYRRQFSH